MNLIVFSFILATLPHDIFCNKPNSIYNNDVIAVATNKENFNDSPIVFDYFNYNQTSFIEKNEQIKSKNKNTLIENENKVNLYRKKHQNELFGARSGKEENMMDYDDVNFEEILGIEKEIQNNETISALRGCKCGQVLANKVVGGRPTTVENYPWTVQLVTAGNHRQFCGGSMISSKYVLTAAHCVEGTKPRSIQIRYAYTKPSTRGVVVNVESIRIHQNYNTNDISRFDIALIKVKTSFRYNKKAQPVCLSKTAAINNKRGIVTGWGATSFGGSTSRVLRVASVKIVNFKTCRRVSQYPDSDLHNRVICGTGMNRDTCQGDSGGPLVYFNNRQATYYLAGITSWGIECADKDFPGIYTNVAAYHSWIIKGTQDSVYCKP